MKILGALALLVLYLACCYTVGHVLAKVPDLQTGLLGLAAFIGAIVLSMVRTYLFLEDRLS